MSSPLIIGAREKIYGGSLARSSTQLPLGSQCFFFVIALAPIFARLEWEKNFNCTRTLASQAMVFLAKAASGVPLKFKRFAWIV